LICEERCAVAQNICLVCDRRMLLFLDKHRPFGYVQTVMTPSTKQSTASRRVISAGVLLFVFFLPLHFHFNSSAKVTQECACVQGTRTQLAPIFELPIYVPFITAQPVIVESDVPRSVEWLGLQCVRAPPASLSV